MGVFRCVKGRAFCYRIYGLYIWNVIFKEINLSTWAICKMKMADSEEKLNEYLQEIGFEII